MDPDPGAARPLLPLLEDREHAAADACTLPTQEQPLRAAEFDALFADALRRTERRTPSRLDLLLDTAAEADARELTAREQQCCSFFTFTFTAVDDAADAAVWLRVEVPETRVEVLDAIEARARG